MQNQVFISYRHEGPEHETSVRRLGKMLKTANIPVTLDSFYLDDFARSSVKFRKRSAR